MICEKGICFMEDKKILIIDQPINNRGDESAHKALIRSILHSMPDSVINVLFIHENQNGINQYDVHDSRVSYININADSKCFPILDRFLYKISPFFPVSLKFHSIGKKIIPIYKASDIILCAPGGMNMGGFQSWRHLTLLLLAKYLKKTVLYYGRSIGPFPTKTIRNKLFKKKSLELLHYFSFLSLRDKKSMEFADSLNVEYEPSLDSAFLESPKVEIPQKVSDLIGKDPYVVFVPNKLIWHYAYRGKVSLEGILSFYKKTLDIIVSKYSNHNVVMLPQTFNFDDTSKGDINFFRDLKHYTQCQKMIIVSDSYNSDLQQTIISKADCVIGARYHSVVFAINQAVPFVALSYEHKIWGLLEMLQITDSMVDITKAFDSEENVQKVLEQFTKALSVAKKNVDAQKQAKELAQECFEKFIKATNKPMK